MKQKIPGLEPLALSDNFIDWCDVTITKDSSGRPTQAVASDGTNTWIKTWAYSAGQDTISKWTKQP